MPRKPLVRSRPGFQPAKGFPDPQAPKPPGPGTVTHMPSRNGTVCGMKLSHASNYAHPERPTCTTCGNYWDAVQASARSNVSKLEPGQPAAVPGEPQA